MSFTTHQHAWELLLDSLFRTVNSGRSVDERSMWLQFQCRTRWYDLSGFEVGRVLLAVGLLVIIQIV
jgi:hypothetical protein